MADDRTVLYALPEDQPDSLAEGTTSKPDWAKPVPPGAGGGKAAASEQDEAPNKSANKSEWESYAQAQGIDTDGMTKDEIIDAVGA